MKVEKFHIYSFYRFFNHTQKKISKKKLESFVSDKLVRGTILLADEGINGTISGKKKDLDNLISLIRKIHRIRKLNIKINYCSFLPFNRIKIRLKKEIVSLGKGYLNIIKDSADLIDPADWDNLIKDKNTTVIDVRNKFEVDIGKFKNAQNPMTDSFRDFPKQLKKMKISKDKKIAIYCTGGIRCEKASAYMRIHGYRNVFQLKGGIIEYLNFYNKNDKQSLWKGECFVFDNRVTINKNLRKGSFLQCHGCRRPITKSDTLSIKYKKGVSCPYCFHERTINQKERSEMRQKQIDASEKLNLKNNFKKLRISDA